MTDNRQYYDAFSEGYDRNRDRGYHKLIDDQAAELVRRVGERKELLEVGCGTGLVLERTARFARRAVGIDLSPGMLSRARQRGLDVHEASATSLPFADASFDVAYSFKVLSHVPQLDVALAEMLRVVRPGGHLVFDIYNRNSLRYVIKKVFGPRATSKAFDEAAITTAFLTPSEVAAMLPAGGRLASVAGIRVITPHPAVFSVPALGRAVQAAEWALMDSAVSRFAGFCVYFVTKER
jgi:ubiquinone/menaquinone biosynthesis C-methylase UbiE